MPSASLSNNRRHRRRNYESVASQDIDGNDGADRAEFQDEQNSTTEDVSSDTAQLVARPKNSNDGNDLEIEDEETDDEDLPMSLIILDSAQKKFPIPCDKNWTVGKFKRRSAKIHKVAPAQQRLIFRGKMLTVDDQTLEENKLDTDDLIVHLFPKPRVVVTTGKKEETEGRPEGADEDGDTGIVDEEHYGAHVPSIVIDQEEQERRGQILVLGSVEIAESQNNVKMLSLLLVMICSMRLLALFSIAMGTVDNSDNYYTSANRDSIYNHTGQATHNKVFDNEFADDSLSSHDYDVRGWETQDYFDLLVSGIGFYVGTLGLKATQENTYKLATAYAMGTIVAGIGWNLWNVYEYYVFVQEQTDSKLDDHFNFSQPDFNNGGDEPEMTRDDFVTVAFFTILLPLFVWFMCCVRAFEFRRLIREAEEEAAERIRNEYTVTEDGTASGTSPEIV